MPYAEEPKRPELPKWRVVSRLFHGIIHYGEIHGYPLLGIVFLGLAMAIGLPLGNLLVVYPAYTEIITGSFEKGADRLAMYVMPSASKGQVLSLDTMDDPRFLADIYRLETTMGLLKIRAFSPAGKTVYSTSPEEIDTLQVSRQALERAAMGEDRSQQDKTTRMGPDGKPFTIDTVRVIVPILHGNTFLGAFELVFDATWAVHKLKRFNTYATLGSVAVSICLLVSLLILLRMENARMQALRQAATLRSDVERITRHDIKSPLISVLNGIQYLESYTDPGKEQMEILADMRTAMNTGMNLINRGLDLYRMECGTYRLVAEEVDMASTCRRVVSDLAGAARGAGATISILLGGAPLGENHRVPVLGEEVLCYAVLANLVKNAIEASENGDKITVELIPGSQLDIRVHNPAPVPEEIRDTFFDKYATAGKSGGTGLGTYSARLMTRVMNGTIHLQSSTETGTTVTVTLPTPQKSGKTAQL